MVGLQVVLLGAPTSLASIMVIDPHHAAVRHVGDMAGYRITPVLIFWTGRALYWVKFTFETGSELPSSCVDIP
jgi:hypothetical protein